MATTHKKCRICGKSYEACRSLSTGVTALDWKAVACCPAHGEKYFTLIAESRKKETNPPEKLRDSTKEKAVEESKVATEVAKKEKPPTKPSENSKADDTVASLVSTIGKKQEET